MGHEPRLTIIGHEKRARPSAVLAAIPAARYVETAAALETALADTEVLLVWDFTTDLLDRVDADDSPLRWVHSASAGVNRLNVEWLRALRPAVTNARGVFDRPIAEFVLGFLLMIAKDMPQSLRFQRSQEWAHRETRMLTGTRAMIVGTGGIGREIARLLAAAGIRIRGAGRRARTADPDFGEVVESAELAAHVADCDWLINAAPLTPETTGLIDARVMNSLPAGAHLVNIGRGATVVTDDLVEALRWGKIAGCALDVIDPEPLPADHPLWSMENVILTPHMSGDTLGWEDRLQEQFLDNWEQFRRGEPFEDAVDLELGFVPGRR